MTKMLTQTSKMPGPSFSTSAFNCQTGSKLAKVKGSVCEKCYARKGFYNMPTVKAAQAKREEFIENANFVQDMVLLINDTRYFRWFDAGDVQSVAQCIKIIDVALRTPNTKHWCPTKEAGYWSKALKMVEKPKNLIVRLSAPMKDERIHPTWTRHTSSVRANMSVLGHSCPAPKQNNTCGDCRACWDGRVRNIVYHEH